jgi:serine/threonine protein kinase/WD40 repeat protein
MTPSQPHTAGAEADDQLVADLVEGLVARLQAGERIDLDACVRDHPECAERLRRLLPAVRILADLGRSAGGSLAGASAAESTPGPLPGVLGDFQILREVGRGGMGVVYEAEQLSLRRRVALKVLPFAAVLDPRHLQRFQNEAHSAACLHHANIVPVYAVGSDRGVHYYAMQFIDGQTLAALIQELRQQAGKEDGGSRIEDRGSRIAESRSQKAGDSGTIQNRAPENVTKQDRPLSSILYPPSSFFRTVARLAIQGAEALEHAHQAGVVHRDVKPANLLLDARGNLWVTDFGLAHCKADAGVTRSGDLVGTLRYMSPEQALGQRRAVDHRTDIYSLGVTLYETLTLEPSFAGDDRQELLRRIVSEDPPPLRRLNPAVPVDLETIIAKAMAKNPDERYGTAQALADDLPRFLEDRPIRARPPPLWQKGKTWVRRNAPLVSSLALFVALSLVASLLGAVVYASTQRQLADEKEMARRSSDAKLHRALLDQSSALRLAHEPGYRAKVWQNLRDAIRLDIPGKDLDQIRASALACLGDPIGLDRVESPSAARAAPPLLTALFQKRIREEFQKWNPTAPAPDRYVHAVSQDGELLAFCPAPAVVQLSPKNGAWRRNLTSHLGAVYDLTFTPDRQYVIAGCEEGVVIWNVSDSPSVTVRSFFRAGNILSVAVHPGGRLLATAGRHLELWSLYSNRLVASVPSPAVGAHVEFSADGKLLLAVENGRVLAGWPVSETPEKRLLCAPQDGVPTVAFSPNGRLLASGSKSGTARIWDVASGRVLHTCQVHPALKGHYRTVEAVAFSPDGNLLATGDFQGSLCLWDAESGKEVTRAGGGRSPPGQIWRLQFSSTGRYLAAGGLLGVAVWEVRTREGVVTLEPFRSIPAPDPGKTFGVYDLAFHPGGTDLVFLGHNGRLYRFNVEKDREPRQLDPPAASQLRSLHFDRGGERLTYVSPYATLGTYDWRTGTVRDTGQQAFQIGLNGRWVATPSAAHEVILYDLEVGRKVVTLPAEGSDIWSLAWSPDGTLLAVGLSDGGLAIWDLEQVRARLTEFDLSIPSTAVAGWGPAGA